MKQSPFNNLLDSKDIGWNDKVTLTVLNPNYKHKWYDPFNLFGKPKTFTFTGYLNYCKDDDNVQLNIPTNLGEVLDSSIESFYMTFEFKDIIGLNIL